MIEQSPLFVLYRVLAVKHLCRGRAIYNEANGATKTSLRYNNEAMKQQDNHEIGRILFDISELYAMQGAEFKPRAFERAAESVRSYEENIAMLYKKGGRRALEKIPGVGKGIAERIEELLKTGHIKEYIRLKKKMPVDIAGLSAIEGIGPQLIKLLYEKLNIKNVAELERAARAGKLRRLPRMGEKLEQKILKGIVFQKSSAGRFLLGDILPLADALTQRLLRIAGVSKVALAGSARRWQETVGDLDFLVTAAHPKKVMDTLARFPEVAHVYAHGETKTNVRLRAGIDMDVRVVAPSSFGAALQYFTGSKTHNVALRKIAIAKGYKLNEYGLYKGTRKVAGRTEEEIYHKLGMSWIPPEMRLDAGEIELARKGRIPRLVELSDIAGDLQVQTDWTDGTDTIETMAREAKRRGWKYIAITDHTRELAMTGGADEKKLLHQMRTIDRLNKKGLGIRILKGAEVNITKDGGLDIRDGVMAQLDIVGAAVHAHFHLPQREQTARVIRAMENPHVDILFHPTGRLIGRREPIALDMKEIFKTAKRTNTILEIDAIPNRLDLHDGHIREARALGVKFAIDTDAHAAAQYAVMQYGVGQARRGWCEKEHIINTLPLGKLLRELGKPKEKRKW